MAEGKEGKSPPIILPDSVNLDSNQVRAHQVALLRDEDQTTKNYLVTRRARLKKLKNLPNSLEAKSAKKSPAASQSRELEVRNREWSPSKRESATQIIDLHAIRPLVDTERDQFQTLKAKGEKTDLSSAELDEYAHLAFRYSHEIDQPVRSVPPAISNRYIELCLQAIKADAEKATFPPDLAHEATELGALIYKDEETVRQTVPPERLKAYGVSLAKTETSQREPLTFEQLISQPLSPDEDSERDKLRKQDLTKHNLTPQEATRYAELQFRQAYGGKTPPRRIPPHLENEFVQLFQDRIKSRALKESFPAASSERETQLHTLLFADNDVLRRQYDHDMFERYHLTLVDLLGSDQLIHDQTKMWQREPSKLDQEERRKQERVLSDAYDQFGWQGLPAADRERLASLKTLRSLDDDRDELRRLTSAEQLDYKTLLGQSIRLRLEQGLDDDHIYSVLSPSDGVRLGNLRHKLSGDTRPEATQLSSPDEPFDQRPQTERQRLLEKLDKERQLTGDDARRLAEFDFEAYHAAHPARSVSAGVSERYHELAIADALAMIDAEHAQLLSELDKAELKRLRTIIYGPDEALVAYSPTELAAYGLEVPADKRQAYLQEKLAQEGKLEEPELTEFVDRAFELEHAGKLPRQVDLSDIDNYEELYKSDLRHAIDPEAYELTKREQQRLRDHTIVLYGSDQELEQLEQSRLFGNIRSAYHMPPRPKAGQDYQYPTESLSDDEWRQLLNLERSLGPRSWMKPETESSGERLEQINTYGDLLVRRESSARPLERTVSSDLQAEYLHLKRLELLWKRFHEDQFELSQSQQTRLDQLHRYLFNAASRLRRETIVADRVRDGVLLPGDEEELAAAEAQRARDFAPLDEEEHATHLKLRELTDTDPARVSDADARRAAELFFRSYYNHLDRLLELDETDARHYRDLMIKQTLGVWQHGQPLTKTEEKELHDLESMMMVEPNDPRFITAYGTVDPKLREKYHGTAGMTPEKDVLSTDPFTPLTDAEDAQLEKLLEQFHSDPSKLTDDEKYVIVDLSFRTKYTSKPHARELDAKDARRYRQLEMWRLHHRYGKAPALSADQLKELADLEVVLFGPQSADPRAASLRFDALDPQLKEKYGIGVEHKVAQVVSYEPLSEKEQEEYEALIELILDPQLEKTDADWEQFADLMFRTFYNKEKRARELDATDRARLRELQTTLFIDGHLDPDRSWKSDDSRMIELDQLWALVLERDPAKLTYLSEALREKYHIDVSPPPAAPVRPLRGRDQPTLPATSVAPRSSWEQPTPTGEHVDHVDYLVEKRRLNQVDPAHNPSLTDNEAEWLLYYIRTGEKNPPPQQTPVATVASPLQPESPTPPVGGPELPPPPIVPAPPASPLQPEAVGTGLISFEEAQRLGAIAIAHEQDPKNPALTAEERKQLDDYMNAVFDETRQRMADSEAATVAEEEGDRRAEYQRLASELMPIVDDLYVAEEAEVEASIAKGLLPNQFVRPMIDGLMAAHGNSYPAVLERLAELMLTTEDVESFQLANEHLTDEELTAIFATFEQYYSDAERRVPGSGYSNPYLSSSLYDLLAAVRAGWQEAKLQKAAETDVEEPTPAEPKDRLSLEQRILVNALKTMVERDERHQAEQNAAGTYLVPDYLPIIQGLSEVNGRGDEEQMANRIDGILNQVEQTIAAKEAKLGYKLDGPELHTFLKEDVYGGFRNPFTREEVAMIRQIQRDARTDQLALAQRDHPDIRSRRRGFEVYGIRPAITELDTAFAGFIMNLRAERDQLTEAMKLSPDEQTLIDIVDQMATAGRTEQATANTEKRPLLPGKAIIAEVFTQLYPNARDRFKRLDAIDMAMAAADRAGRAHETEDRQPTDVYPVLRANYATVVTEEERLAITTALQAGVQEQLKVFRSPQRRTDFAAEMMQLDESHIFADFLLQLRDQFNAALPPEQEVAPQSPASPAQPLTPPTPAAPPQPVAVEHAPRPVAPPQPVEQAPLPPAFVAGVTAAFERAGQSESWLGSLAGRGKNLAATAAGWVGALGRRLGVGREAQQTIAKYEQYALAQQTAYQEAYARAMAAREANIVQLKYWSDFLSQAVPEAYGQWPQLIRFMWANPRTPEQWARIASLRSEREARQIGIEDLWRAAVSYRQLDATIPDLHRQLAAFERLASQIAAGSQLIPADPRALQIRDALRAHLLSRREVLKAYQTFMQAYPPVLQLPARTEGN